MDGFTRVSLRSAGMSSSKTAHDVKRTCRPVCCRLTGGERSAVAVVGVRGPGSAEAIARCFTPAKPRRLQAGEVRFGRWHGAGEENSRSAKANAAAPIATESVVLTPLDDDSFEVHCHGGPAAVDRILSDLQSLGAVRLEPNQWVPDEQRPLVLREAEEVLRQCLTARTAARAMDQVRGALLRWAEHHLAALQAEPTESALRALQAECRTRLQEAAWGCRLSDPFRVVLCGPPNVGKSSLVNAIVGYERSITFDQAGTTRDVLHAETVIEGLPVRLTDTAGLRLSEEMIEREGVSRARRAALAADLVIWVSQPQQAPGPSEHASAETADLETPPAAKHLRVLNKADLLDAPSPPSELPADMVLTVATTGQGVEELIGRIATSLVDSAGEPGDPLVLNERQVECLQQTLAATTAEAAVEGLGRLIHG